MHDDASRFSLSMTRTLTRLAGFDECAAVIPQNGGLNSHEFSYALSLYECAAVIPRKACAP